MTQRIDRGFPDDSEQLYAENLGLVYHLVDKYLVTNPTADYEALEYVAMGAYINAIRLYDSSSRARFSTYAYVAIKNAIIRELDGDYRRRALIAGEISRSKHEYTGVRRPTENAALNRVTREAIANAHLTEMEKSVLELHLIQKMTFLEISQLYSNSRQACFFAYTQAVKKLQNNAIIRDIAREA